MNSNLEDDTNGSTNKEVVERKNEIQGSIENWVSDARSLVQSPEFSRFAKSTLHLAVNTTSTIAKVCFLPITGPIHLAGNVTNATVSFLTNTIISPDSNEFTNTSRNDKITGNTLDHRSLPPIDRIWDRILHVSHVGLIWSFAKRCTEKAIQIIRHNGYYFHTVDTVQEYDSTSHFREIEQPLEKKSNNQISYFLLRICSSHDFSHTESIQTHKNLARKPSQKSFIKKSTKQHSNLDSFEYDPIVYIEMEIHKKSDSLINDIRFDISSMKDALDSMSQLANHLAYIPFLTHPNQCSDIPTCSKIDSCRHVTHLKHSIVEWKPESKTNAVLPKLQGQVKVIPTILDKQVLVWSGKHKISKMEYPTCGIYGYDVPFLKGYGIIHASPESIFSLLLDDDRIKEYNKHNLMRTNIAVLDDIMQSYTTQKNDKENDTHHSEEWSNIQTKIVSSKTSVPFTKFTIPFLTIVHARKLEKEDGYIIVSRSLDTSVAQKNRKNNDNDEIIHETEKQDKYKYASFLNGKESRSKIPSNHIIWSVSVMKPVKEDRNKTELTIISQVQSSSLPNFLVHKIGVSGVFDLFTNLRQIFPPVT